MGNNKKQQKSLGFVRSPETQQSQQQQVRITLSADVLHVIEEYGEIIGVDDTTQVVNAILKRVARVGVARFFDQSRADVMVAQNLHHAHHARLKNAVSINNAGGIVHVSDEGQE